MKVEMPEFKEDAHAVALISIASLSQLIPSSVWRPMEHKIDKVALPYHSIRSNEFMSYETKHYTKDKFIQRTQ